MRTIHSLTQSRAFFGRALIGVALTLGVIVGLLAMHTLSAGDPGHGHSTSAVVGAAYMHPQSMPDHAGVAELEPCDCGTNAPAEDHSMLMMACVLGLLVTLLVLILPIWLGRVDTREMLLSLTTERARRARARPRPPSLNFLSISRT